MRRDQESTKVAPRGEMAPMDVTTTRRRSIVERARESCREWSELCIARGWGGCGCCGRNFIVMRVRSGKKGTYDALERNIFRAFSEIIITGVFRSFVGFISNIQIHNW
jgi:hypothetical protein